MFLKIFYVMAAVRNGIRGQYRSTICTAASAFPLYIVSWRGYGSLPEIFRNLPGPSLAVTVPGFPKIFQAASADAPQVILWVPRERKCLLTLPKTTFEAPTGAEMASSVPGEGFGWHDGHGKAAKRARMRVRLPRRTRKPGKTCPVSENGGEIALDSPETAQSRSNPGNKWLLLTRLYLNKNSHSQTERMNADSIDFLSHRYWCISPWS